MKTTNLIINHEAAKPIDLTELMLVNALGQIEDLENEIDILKTIVERQDHILETLKKAAEFHKSDYKDYISIDWIRRGDEGFHQLLEAFELEDEAEEQEEEDNE